MMPNQTQPSYTQMPQQNFNQTQFGNLMAAQQQMQTIPQYQQPIQQQMYQSPSDRVVNSKDEITPGEVPMDGKIHLFPLSDYSMIIAKVWDNNGLLRTFNFIPEQPAKPEESNNSSDPGYSAIMNRLDNIEKIIKKNGYRMYYKDKKNKEEA